MGKSKRLQSQRMRYIPESWGNEKTKSKIKKYKEIGLEPLSRVIKEINV